MTVVIPLERIPTSGGDYSARGFLPPGGEHSTSWPEVGCSSKVVEYSPEVGCSSKVVEDSAHLPPGGEDSARGFLPPGGEEQYERTMRFMRN